ncbi:hypothetical protein EZ449_12440 [Pedobacter frigidisoli]|uniref:Uncharacterized protein n=1 Tax=Pedobacter frigidisoli TaxID=2530455 RepID=A0A4V2MMQ5_9SPHI|nr:hypothetical protein [Pedobacter frigidisoli]TCD08212.1 hypothetical protein EZ449_12440 [Pedobacter frigidisoli]
MKTITKNIKWLFIIVVGFSFTSCKKDSSVVDEINKIEIQKKQIQDVIPGKYLDSLKKLGLVVNTGVNPINVEGYYAINPLILQSTNIPKDFAIGYRFSDARLSLSNQDANFGIRLLGRGFLATSDTSIVTAISGSGNDFTIYGKVKSQRNTKVAEFAIIISGTLENKIIKNFKYGLICISNKNPETDSNFIREGQGRVVLESDAISGTITEKDFVSLTRENQLLQLANPGSLRY